MSLPRSLSDVDLSEDCETAGHVFGPISGNVRHCERFGCEMRDGLDPDDFATANGDPYDWDDPDRDELGYNGPDAFVLRAASPPALRWDHVCRETLSDGRTLTVSIDRDNAAFYDDETGAFDPDDETARIMAKARDAATTFTDDSGICRDYNGNTVGGWRVSL